MALLGRISLFFVTLCVLSGYVYCNVLECVYTISEHTEGDPIKRHLGRVSEQARLSDIVGQTDFSNLRYSFLTTGSSSVSLFHIDEKTSDIYTAQILDRESIQACEFKQICILNLDVAVQATKGSFFRKINVKVYVDDVNDNAPIFDKPFTELSISEAVLVGTSITIDGARDKDTSQQYSLSTYEVLPPDSPFSIKYLKNLDGTSIVQLIIKRALNREIQYFYEITVVAKDGGSPPKIGTTKVNITVTDVNDCSPIFSMPLYNVTVKEDINVSSVILKVTATDEDEGKNGRIFYRISPHQSEENLEIFGINNQTGELFLKKRLVYMDGEMYRIIVEASDMGDQPLTAQTLAYVYVKDVGNSPPEIKVSLLSGIDVGLVSELADTGAVVAHIEVVDPDTGRNGDIACNIYSSVFSLDRLDAKEFKIIVNGELNRETKDTYHVRLTCRDSGNPPLKSNAEFMVEVTDENDSPPIFASNIYEETITENNLEGEIITQVSASDADIGKNAEILYYISDNFSRIAEVNSDTGIVRTKIVFDREAKKTYKFEVYAIDKGNPPYTGTTTVSIVILDKNDKPPVFVQPVFTFDIYENHRTGTDVNQLSATDDDEGINARIRYAMVTESSTTVPFHVLPDGTLKTTKELDRETQSIYDFYVMAEDTGSPVLSSTARVKVIVKDENDNAPVITAPSTTNNTIRFSLYTTPRTLVTTIRAFDLDDGINSEVRYSITQRNDSNIFKLNDVTGALILNKKITQKDGDILLLEITATDQGSPRLTSTRMVNIIISKNVGEPAKSNFMLVIIFVVVTVVFSSVIIATICILRRSDRMKKHKDKEMYQKANFHSGVTVYSLPGEESLSDKKKKKEVSFSLEEDEMFQIDPHQMRNNNLSLDGHLESKDVQKQEDNNSVISADASDSGRGGSDDETRSPHSSGLQQNSTSQRPWYEYQRGLNTEMQTFNSFRPSTSTGLPVNHMGAASVPPTKAESKVFNNSVPNVHIHVTAEKLQRPGNVSFDSGKFTPTIDLHNDIVDCVV